MIKIKTFRKKVHFQKRPSDLFLIQMILSKNVYNCYEFFYRILAWSLQSYRKKKQLKATIIVAFHFRKRQLKTNLSTLMMIL